MKLLVLLPVATLLLFPALAAETPDRPNVILIFTDDQGYGDLGCFGAKGFETPNIDRLAREGRRFTNFHVSQPVCSASRASLLTGCYANRIGIHGALGPKAAHGIHSNEVTLAEVFKQKGFATGMAGKWHLGHREPFLPTRHGFDEYYGLPYSNDMWPHHPEAKKGTYPTLPLIQNQQILDDDVSPEDQPRLTTDYTARAVRFIEQNKDRPFFFYLAHSMPHVPLYVSDRFKGKSKSGLHGDVMMEIDWSVGQVIAALDKHGLREKTLVIFTTDNGPWLSYGQHAGSSGGFREGKGTVWEGGVRVPCIMRWPGKIPPGSASDAMLMTIDILPTLASVIGADLPRHAIDGRNVWPLISGDPTATNPHDAYFFYYEQNQLQALTTGDGRWKLILPHTYRTLGGQPGGTNGIPAKYTHITLTEPELYDLRQDPTESNNIAAQNDPIVQKLLVFAEAARTELGDSLTKRQGRAYRPPGKAENETE